MWLKNNLDGLNEIDLSKIDENNDGIIWSKEEKNLWKLLNNLQKEIIDINNKGIVVEYDSKEKQIIERKIEEIDSLLNKVSLKKKDSLYFIKKQLFDFYDDIWDNKGLKIDYDINRYILLKKDCSKYLLEDLANPSLFDLIIKWLFKEKKIDEILKISKTVYWKKIFEHLELFDEDNNHEQILEILINASLSLEDTSTILYKIELLKEKGFGIKDIEKILDRMSSNNKHWGFHSTYDLWKLLKIGISKSKIKSYLIENTNFNLEEYMKDNFFNSMWDFLIMKDEHWNNVFSKKDIKDVFLSFSNRKWEDKTIILKKYTQYSDYFNEEEKMYMLDKIFSNLTEPQKIKYNKIKELFFKYPKHKLIDIGNIYFENNLFKILDKAWENEFIIDLDNWLEKKEINVSVKKNITNLKEIDKFEKLFLKLNLKEINNKKLWIFLKRFIIYFTKKYPGQGHIWRLLKILDDRFYDIKKSIWTWKEKLSIKLLLSSLKSLENFSTFNDSKKIDDNFFIRKEKILPLIIKEDIKKYKIDSLWKIKEVSLIVSNDSIEEFIWIIKAMSKGINKINIIYKKDENIILLKKILSKWELLKINFIKKEDLNYRNNDKWIRDWAVQIDWKIVESFSNRQVGSSESYDKLSLPLNLELEQSNLYFEWWNVRQTNSYVFIWYDDIYKNIEWIKTNAKINEVKEKFEKMFNWKKVIIIWLENHKNWKYKIKKRSQEIFHIDMYITPVSDREIIVWRFEKWNIKNEYLNKEALRLSKMWFTVHRIDNIEKDISGSWSLTYNNSLIENYKNNNWKTIKKVFLPEYNFDDLIKYNPKTSITKNDVLESNRKAINLYKSFGYEVISVPISADFINSWGSLNCITFEKR